MPAFVELRNVRVFPDDDPLGSANSVQGVAAI
jgi:hypothetical protein